MFKFSASFRYGALNYLKSEPRINSMSLGLATNSESVRFAPEIAAHRNDISFVYGTVGGVVDMKSLSLFQMAHRTRKEHGESSANEIIGIYEDVIDLYVRSAKDPSYFNEVKAALDKRMSDAWSKYGGTLPFGRRVGTYNESYVRRMAYNYSYDPRDYFDKSFKTPFYYDFAELDINVPTDASVASLEEIMRRGEHQIEYKIWPGIDHDFGEIYWAWYGIYPKGYLDRMTDWTWEVVSNNSANQIAF